MTSDLSQLGGFARASVLELTRAGYHFAGVENGIVRVVSPCGGPAFEFTNDSYTGTSVYSRSAGYLRTDAALSTDDGDLSASLGGAELAPLYDDTSNADAPAINAPDWDADAEIVAALEQYHAPADTDDDADPSASADANDDDPEPIEAHGQDDTRTASESFVDLGFDQATAARLGEAADAAGLTASAIEAIADQLLSYDAPATVRLPRKSFVRITVSVTRSGRQSCAVASMQFVTTDPAKAATVNAKRTTSNPVPYGVSVRIAEAAAVAKALAQVRGSAEVYVYSTHDLSPESRPVVRGSRSVWDALARAAAGHDVTWYSRRTNRR